jgi:hypothetical protein
MSGKRDRLSVAALVLRAGISLVLVVWALGAFVHPVQYARILEAHYGVTLPLYGIYAAGALQLAIALAFLSGVRTRVTAGLVMTIVAASALAPGRLYLHPFMDHVLLFFANWTMLAGAFLVYATQGRPEHQPPRAGTAGTSVAADLQVGLLLLRLSLVLAFGMWCIDKFVNPVQTTRILNGFYGISGVSFAAAHAMGVAQAVLLLAVLTGTFKRVSYGLLMLSHIPAVFAPWDQYLHPYEGHVLAFLPAFPMWSACFALYYLRAYDVRGVLSLRGGEAVPPGADAVDASLVGRWGG